MNSSEFGNDKIIQLHIRVFRTSVENLKKKTHPNARSMKGINYQNIYKYQYSFPFIGGINKLYSTECKYYAYIFILPENNSN